MPAPEGNKYAEKYPLEVAKDKFLEILEYAKTKDDCYSLQDAVLNCGMPLSTYDLKAKEHPELGSLKNDTKGWLTVRINYGTLKGDFNPSAGIWRQKMLGEREIPATQHIVNTNIEHKPLTAEEIKKKQEEIDDMI